MGSEPALSGCNLVLIDTGMGSLCQLQSQDAVANYEGSPWHFISHDKKSCLRGTGPALNQYLPHAIKLISIVVISIGQPGIKVLFFENEATLQLKQKCLMEGML